MMNGWDGGMSTAGWIFMVLLWVLLIVVIVWAVTQLVPSRRQVTSQGEPPAPAANERPETILARRLARGEIDPDTYDRLRQKLAEHREQGGPGAS